MCDAAERIIGAEAEHVGERCGAALLRGGVAQRLEQRGRRLGADALRQAAHRAGERRMIIVKRVGTLRAPAVGRGVGLGDMGAGVVRDALHGCGKNMMSDIRRHNNTPSADGC